MEDTVVTDRLIEIWESRTKIVRYWERLPKSKQSSSKSFFKVQEAVNDKFILAKFNFFSFFGSTFKPFLTKYQTRWPMVAFMYDDLKNLVKSTLQLYIKQSVIGNCSNVIAYKNINLLNKSNIVIKKKTLTLGCATELAIAELEEIEAFKTECLTFLITTTQKIFERSPLGSTIARYASSLNPANLNHPSTPGFFKSLISRLVYLKILQPKLGDKALSHGQADIERGFSLNMNLLKENIGALTITSRCKIKDYLLCNKIKLNTYTIPSESVQLLRQKYEVYL